MPDNANLAVLERFVAAVFALAGFVKGAIGLGIGHVLEGIRLHKLLTQLDIEPGSVIDAPVHYGGPVEPSRGFVLHSLDWGGEGTVQASDRFALTGTMDVLKAIAGGRGPSRWLVALGYAGWGAGQLDAEMRRHGWYATTAREEIVFDTPASRRWTAASRPTRAGPRRRR